MNDKIGEQIDSTQVLHETINSIDCTELNTVSEWYVKDDINYLNSSNKEFLDTGHELLNSCTDAAFLFDDSESEIRGIGDFELPQNQAEDWTTSDSFLNGNAGMSIPSDNNDSLNTSFNLHPDFIYDVLNNSDNLFHTSNGIVNTAINFEKELPFGQIDAFNTFDEYKWRNDNGQSVKSINDENLYIVSNHKYYDFNEGANIEVNCGSDLAVGNYFKLDENFDGIASNDSYKVEALSWMNEESGYNYFAENEYPFLFVDELINVTKWDGYFLEREKGFSEVNFYEGIWNKDVGRHTEDRGNLHPAFTRSIVINSYNSDLILEDEDLLDKIAVEIINRIQLSDEQTDLFNMLEKIDSDLAKVYSGALKNYQLKIDNYVMIVAHSLRELVNITLRTLAPDEKVKTWLKNRTNKLKGVTDDNGNPYREARIHYIFRNQPKKRRKLIQKEILFSNELYGHLCSYSHTLSSSESKLILNTYIEKTESHLKSLLIFLNI